MATIIVLALKKMGREDLIPLGMLMGLCLDIVIFVQLFSNI
jgi:hypothetical protein